MKLPPIKMEMIIANPEDVLAKSKRLHEIAKELSLIAYQLNAKLEIKEKPPENNDSDGGEIISH